MNAKFKQINKNYFLKSYIKLLIIFNLLNSTFSLLIDNIIRFGSLNFRFCHFSFNSDGDMILDTSSYPKSSERKFFGIKQNGHFCFKDEDNEETPFTTNITVGHAHGRIEGESYFIKLTSNNIDIHGNELILGISKNYPDTNQSIYMEFYNLTDRTAKIYLTSNALGYLVTDSFSIIKTPEESETFYSYILTYIAAENYYKYYFTLKKTYFSYDFSKGCNHVNEENSFEIANHRMISCFFTVLKRYICFYLKKDKTTFIARAYESDLSNPKETNVYTSTYTYNEKFFFKSIHFKGEIGFFIYFQASNYLKFSILKCNDNREMITYSTFSKVSIDKTNFNADDRLNDILKLNDFQLIYLSVSKNYTHFKFVTFTLYKNDTLINIRYYQIEMWPQHSIRIFHDLKGALYKNFIALAFSNCPEEACTTSGTHNIYASLIIFCYPNSTDNNLDIIPQLYETNKNIENDFSFNFEGTLKIENNLFGYVFKGTKIMKMPIGLNLTNPTNGNILEVESIILKDENVSLNFETHENYIKKDYIIEYAYVLEEPNYEVMEAYYTYIDKSKGNQQENEKNYYKKYEYIGRTSNFSLIIKENLTNNCYDDSCSLCLTNYTCIICKYNYTFNNNNKTCFPDPFAPTNVLTTIPTNNQHNTETNTPTNNK